MIANTYSHVMEELICRYSSSAMVSLSPDSAGGDLDLAGQARVLAVVRELGEQVAFVGHRGGSLSTQAAST